MLKLGLLLLLVVSCSCSSNETDERRVKRGYIWNGHILSEFERAFQAPWVVSLQNALSPGKGVCSGVLISRRHVLTAAHCLGVDEKQNCKNFEDPYKIIMKFGEVGYWSVLLNSATGKIKPGDKVVPVYKITFPTTYSRHCKTFENAWEDIAIFEMPIDVTVPYLPLYNKKYSGVEILRQYGYGLTGLKNQKKEEYKLRSHELTQVGNDRCNPYWSDIKNWFCMVGNNSMSCRGDSGGPTVFTRRDPQLVGLLSKGYSCITIKEEYETNGDLTENNEMFLTEIYPYLEWICHFSGVCPPGVQGKKDRPTSINTAFYVPPHNRNGSIIPEEFRNL